MVNLNSNQFIGSASSIGRYKIVVIYPCLFSINCKVDTNTREELCIIHRVLFHRISCPCSICGITHLHADNSAICQPVVEQYSSHCLDGVMVRLDNCSAGVPSWNVVRSLFDSEAVGLFLSGHQHINAMTFGCSFYGVQNLEYCFYRAFCICNKENSILFPVFIFIFAFWFPVMWTMLVAHNILYLSMGVRAHSPHTNGWSKMPWK